MGEVVKLVKREEKKDLIIKIKEDRFKEYDHLLRHYQSIMFDKYHEYLKRPL